MSRSTSLVGIMQQQTEPKRNLLSAAQAADLKTSRKLLETAFFTDVQLLDALLERAHDRYRQGWLATPQPFAEFLVDQGYLGEDRLKAILEDTAPPKRDPRPTSDVSISVFTEEAGEMDRALAVLARQTRMVLPEAVRAVQDLTKELATFGLRIPLLELLEKMGFLSRQQYEELKAIDFKEVIETERWKTQVIPGYNVTSKIAKGGFGTIFIAEPLFGGEPVALKILHKAHARNERAIDQFRHEGGLLHRFAHPNVVHAQEMGTYRGLYFIVMDYVSGSPIDERVTAQGCFDPATAIRVTRQVASALEYMAREGFLHRDIKPENILMDDRGTARICDLGFAGRMAAAAVGRSEVTLGTVAYMSPEQGEGRLDLDVSSDIYSLGLSLYFMLAGHALFAPDGRAPTIQERFSKSQVPDLSKLQASRGLIDVIRQMLEPDREKRIRTYTQLRLALERAR